MAYLVFLHSALSLAHRGRTVATSSTRPDGAPSSSAGGVLECFFVLVILGVGEGVVLSAIEGATKSLLGWAVVKGSIMWLLSDVVCLQTNVVVLVKVQLWFLDAADREGWIV